MKRLLTTLVAVATVVLPLAAATPAGAAASYVDAAVAALKHDSVYVDPGAEAADKVDAGALRDLIRRDRVAVKIAVLPDAARQSVGGDPTGLAIQIGQRIGGRGTVGVVSGRSFRAASDVLADANALARDAISAKRSEGFTKTGVTDTLREFVTRVDAAGPSGSSGSSGSSPSRSTSASSGAGLLLAVLAVLVLAIAAVVALVVLRRRRRQRDALTTARADATSLWERLGSDVSTISPGDDAAARQAMADASERYNAAGSLLSRARTPGELAAARRTAIEGLTAARAARARLGLDPGPDLPPPVDGQGRPRLEQPQEVAVGDGRYTGYPTYTPGAPYYYGGGMLGGSMVPGGWYSMPFWEGMLLGGALGGALGGWGGGWGGGGYGYGYDQGYDRGYDRAVDEQQDDQNAWTGGDGGGSDWTGGDSGGGDWGGGDSGGGDWGGGGDSGGGDW